MNNIKPKRRKAFLGALVGGLVGVAGSAISGVMSKKAAEKQAREQRINQNRRATYEMAANLTNAYSDEDWSDELKNRVTFKQGGKMKKQKFNSTDRLAVAKKFKCGGRKKAENGTSTPIWTSTDTSNLISVGMNAIGSGLGNGIASSADTSVDTPISYSSRPKIYKRPDYAGATSFATPNISYNDRIEVYKCGGSKKKAKCGTRKKAACGGKK